MAFLGGASTTMTLRERKDAQDTWFEHMDAVYVPELEDLDEEAWVNLLKGAKVERLEIR